jgi:formate hydrogenlyase subunit 4
MRAKKTTWVFATAPIIMWSCYGVLAFAVPSFGQPPLLQTDLVTFIYLLATARVAFALAGMDASAPFGGLGSSRSMFINLPTELSLILISAALALHWDTVSLAKLADKQLEPGWRIILEADLLLVALAFMLMISLETGRPPIDNPGTHLELTMSHKAIALEYAGGDLALVEWAEAVKLCILLSLFVSLFMMPFTKGITESVWVSMSFLAFLGGAVVSLAIREASRPKLRLRTIIQPGIAAAVLCLLAILYRVITGLIR